MALDLTRFDFNALRFTKSEQVLNMSLEEVGQYIFLLAEAWLAGKEASLPDNVEILSKLARCKKVSEKVLAQFPVVETIGGLRRRNETLYGEWVVTRERIASAVESGRRGGEAKKAAYSEPNTYPTRVPTSSLEASGSVALAITKPDQSYPTQTNPDQNFGQCTFKFIAVRYSSFFGINHSHSKKHIEKYQNACARHGEDLVLNIFDRWAGSAGWLKERRDSNGLNFFWKPMEEIIEGDQLRLDREESVRKPDADLENKMTAQILQEQELDALIHAEKAKQIEERKKFEAAHANEI